MHRCWPFRFGPETSSTTSPVSKRWGWAEPMACSRRSIFDQTPHRRWLPTCTPSFGPIWRTTRACCWLRSTTISTLRSCWSASILSRRFAPRKCCSTSARRRRHPTNGRWWRLPSDTLRTMTKRLYLCPHRSRGHLTLKGSHKHSSSAIAGFRRYSRIVAVVGCAGRAWPSHAINLTRPAMVTASGSTFATRRGATLGLPRRSMDERHIRRTWRSFIKGID